MRIIKVGRSQENDYLINEPEVSSFHAVITVSDDRIIRIRDLNSLNGTYVNGKRIVSDTVITQRDEVKLGKRILDLSSVLSKPSKTKVAVNIPASQNIPNNIVDKRTIGRGANCQIRMNNDDVSNNHALLYKLSTGEVAISDMGSTNGTYVNGQRISTSQTLKSGDVVTIARHYPLAWETIMPNKKEEKNNKWWMVAVVLVFIILAGGTIWMYNPWNNGRLTGEEVYERYNSAVCLVCISYGYEVKLESQSEGENIHSLLGIEEDATVIWDEKKGLSIGMQHATGTAFFIAKDGRMATNLHITRPWLFKKEKEQIAQMVRQFLKLKALKENPLYDTYIFQVKVVGKIKMGVVPNGLPLSEANYTPCREYRGHDDTTKDVAIIQTETHNLPQGVHAIINMDEAQVEADEYKEGRNVYLIGFPYGTTLADTEKGLQNQLQSGSITQSRGDYEFGHNAATAGGASGSPVLNEKGKLIGVHHAGMTGLTGAQGFNWAIKAKFVLELAN